MYVTGQIDHHLKMQKESMKLLVSDLGKLLANNFRGFNERFSAQDECREPTQAPPPRRPPRHEEFEYSYKFSGMSADEKAVHYVRGLIKSLCDGIGIW